MRPIQIDGTLDIECSDWDRFELGAIYDGHTSHVYYSPDDLLDALLARGGTWWAHAGGIYDHLLMLDRMLARGMTAHVDRAQQRVTRVVCGGLTLRDSYALWPAPLDALCGAIGEPVPALPWGCICGEACGGYCQIGPRAMHGDPDLEDYCIADTRRLYDALLFLRDWTDEHGITLRGTIGMTAWGHAERALGLRDPELPWEIWRKSHEADYGGRIVVSRPRARGPGTQYDLCNAYPAALARADLPVGVFREVGGARARRAFAVERPGLYTARVTVPDGELPPLPFRLPGDSLVVYPVGTFGGSWALPELQFALARGTKIEEVSAAIVWEDTRPIFGGLVRDWYALRRAEGRGSPIGQWVSRLAKALAGKLGERPDRQRIAIHPKAIRICNRQGRCGRGCTGRCGGYEQIDLAGHVWGIPYSKLSPCAHPHWSAYLHALARIQLAEGIEATGIDEHVYSHTDSVWTTARVTPDPLGDDLGQWERQGTFARFESRGGATYAFRDGTGAFQVRGACGLTEEDWNRGAGRLDRGVISFRAAAAAGRGLFRRRSRLWSRPKAERLWYGDRVLGGDGRTHPVSAEQWRKEAPVTRR